MDSILFAKQVAQVQSHQLSNMFFSFRIKGGWKQLFSRVLKLLGASALRIGAIAKPAIATSRSAKSI